MKKNILFQYLFPLGISLCGLFSVSSHVLASEELYQTSFFHFDTIISLQFYAEENGSELIKDCVALFDDYEHIFSRTLEDSELYRINHRTQKTMEISQELADVISEGLYYYELSDGAFDFTVTPLSQLWDFTGIDPSVPDPSEIAAALKKVDASQIHLDGTTLTLLSDDTTLDLGALAKGYAADKLKSYLLEQGVTSGILNLGGNVLTIGTKPDGSNWKVGIQRPFSTEDPIAEIVEVNDQSVVTSGIYERYFEKNGTIYHHILDTTTGYPVENDIDGVSVLCSSSLRADALSTTCLVLGYEKALKLITSAEDAEALFILDDGSIHKTF